MTTVYFIRHAEPDISVHDDFSRPLTPKGAKDCELVTKFLKNKNIQVALSSPYKRALDTILPFTKEAELEIEMVENFKERHVSNGWIKDFKAFSMRQWADFSYKLEGGESLLEVQKRSMKALKKALAQHSGKNIVVATHGTALSTIIHYYENTYGYADFQSIAGVFPWVVVMTFDEQNGVKIEKIDLFESNLYEEDL